MSGESQYARFGSGKSVRRVEDQSLLTGAGMFADDVSLPGQAYVCFLRSPYPHARMVAIDTAAASAMPGVIAIVTGADLVRAGVKPLPLSADFRRGDGSPTASPPRHALAVDTVRFVGEAVAAVIAQQRRRGARRGRGDRRAATRRCRWSPISTMPSPPARRWCGPRPPATSPPR